MDNIIPPMEQYQPNDLLIFARVAEAGSFSRAAKRVGLPKSTVSRRIALLEERLGERLMLRTTRRLTLTEFGIQLLEHARQVAAEVDAVKALSEHRQTRPSGRLRVSMPSDFATMLLTDMLAAFIALHPAVSLELDLSPRIVDLLGENFDLALRMGDLPDDALRLLGRSGASVGWTLLCGDQRWDGDPPGRTAANSPELLISLARGGAGIAAVPDHFAAPSVRRGELRRVLPDWRLPSFAAWAVFPGRRLMPAKTRAFIEMLEVALAGADGNSTERIGGRRPMPRS